MTRFYESSAEAQWRESRRILAKTFALVDEVVTGPGTLADKARKVELFADLGTSELNLAVVARGQMLREKFLQAHA